MLYRVLQLLRNNSLKVKIEKCNLLRTEIVYLRHKCSVEGALPNLAGVECVRNLPVPRNRKEVQSFLGLINYYRKFIRGTAEIALAINKLLCKDSPFHWTKNCQKAFERLKTRVAGR